LKLTISAHLNQQNHVCIYYRVNIKTYYIEYFIVRYPEVIIGGEKNGLYWQSRN
jgi:hypothetical protein